MSIDISLGIKITELAAHASLDDIKSVPYLADWDEKVLAMTPRKQNGPK